MNPKQPFGSKNMFKLIGIYFAGIAMACLSAKANLLVNGSFEAPNSNYRYVRGGSSLLPGWRTELNGVEIVTDRDIGVGYTYLSTIQDGKQMVDLAPFVYTGGGISQTFPTSPGLSYEVSFYASSVQSFGKNGTGSLIISVDSVVQHLELITRQADFDWKPYRFAFVASDSQATLKFVSLSDPFRQFAAIDNVSVVQVPEVSSVVMGLVGVAALVAVRRRWTFARSSE